MAEKQQWKDDCFYSSSTIATCVSVYMSTPTSVNEATNPRLMHILATKVFNADLAVR